MINLIEQEKLEQKKWTVQEFAYLIKFVCFFFLLYYLFLGKTLSNC